jgi:hypothetical protein
MFVPEAYGGLEVSPAAVLVATWSLFWGLTAGLQGWRLVANSVFGPLVMVSILAALIVVIEISALRARGRTFALVGAGLAAAALGLVIEWQIMVAILKPTLPFRWPMAVMWWAVFGGAAAIQDLGRVIVYDYRVTQRKARRAAQGSAAGGRRDSAHRGDSPAGHAGADRSAIPVRCAGRRRANSRCRCCRG